MFSKIVGKVEKSKKVLNCIAIRNQKAVCEEVNTFESEPLKMFGLYFYDKNGEFIGVNEESFYSRYGSDNLYASNFAYDKLTSFVGLDKDLLISKWNERLDNHKLTIEDVYSARTPMSLSFMDMFKLVLKLPLTSQHITIYVTTNDDTKFETEIWIDKKTKTIDTEDENSIIAKGINIDMSNISKKIDDVFYVEISDLEKLVNEHKGIDINRSIVACINLKSDFYAGGSKYDFEYIPFVSKAETIKSNCMFEIVNLPNMKKIVVAFELNDNKFYGKEMNENCEVTSKVSADDYDEQTLRSSNLSDLIKCYNKSLDLMKVV